VEVVSAVRLRSILAEEDGDDSRRHEDMAVSVNVNGRE
jgi:hypothetical protein